MPAPDMSNPRVAALMQEMAQRLLEIQEEEDAAALAAASLGTQLLARAEEIEATFDVTDPNELTTATEVAWDIISDAWAAYAMQGAEVFDWDLESRPLMDALCEALYPDDEDEPDDDEAPGEETPKGATIAAALSRLSKVAEAPAEPASPARRPRKAAPAKAASRRAPRGRVDLSAQAEQAAIDNPFANGIPGVHPDSPIVLTEPLKTRKPRRRSTHNIPGDDWVTDAGGRRVPADQKGQ